MTPTPGLSTPPSLPDLPPPAARPGSGLWLPALIGALVVVLAVWVVVEHRRRTVQAEHAAGWREAYAWLLATASCPLCGSRMEPGSTWPAPVREPHGGELR